MKPEDRIQELEKLLHESKEDCAGARIELKVTRETLQRVNGERDAAITGFHKLRRRIFDIQREMPNTEHVSFTLDIDIFWRLGNESEREKEIAYMIGDGLHACLCRKSGADFALRYVQSLIKK